MGTFGVIRCISCTATISNSHFQDNIAMYGGVLYLVDAASVTMTGCELYNGKAVYNGAFVHATYTTTAVSAKLTLSSCSGTVQFFETYQSYGGFIYSNNAKFDFSTSSCNFNSIQSYSKGGFIYSDYMNSIAISTAIMSNITGSSDGILIYTKNNAPTITITSLT